MFVTFTTYFYLSSINLTKHYGLSGLNDKNLFLTLLEAGKSEDRVSAWSGSSEDPLPGLQTVIFLLCPPMAGREITFLRSVSSYKGTNPIHKGSIHDLISS